MHPTLRKFFTALGVRTDHSFYLSQFRQRGGRQLSIFGLIFLFTFALNRFSGWLDNDIFGFQLQTVTNLFLTLSVCGIGWSALWMRTRSVKVQKSKIVLSLPFGQVEIPWSDIRDVEPIAFSTLYPIDEISLAQRQRLGRLYKRTGLRVRLKTAGLGWKRWLLPWPMLGEDPRTIFLLVNNWSKLAERIPEISNGRLVKRTAEANINLSNAPIPQIPSNSREKSKKQGVDLLFITPGGRHTKQLIQLVRQKYELAVARTPIDAVKKIRAVQPTLVIVDDQLLDESKLLGLVQSLQRQQHRFKSGYLCLTQSQIDPDLELELFDVGVKEMLDIRRGLQLTIKRIDFWLDWQGQVKNMARRNQELYGQNLYQRSELARHGELKHFLPKDVAQEVIDGVYNAESHRLRRQTVTVLFADIVGFTPLSSQLAPEVLAELLNEYLQTMTQVVVNHGGIVDKFIGDEVMAIFGAPEEQPETIQVQNAFTAALSMIEVVKALHKKWEKRLPAELSIRIGINTGECTAGVFGSDSLRSYTVIGSPVNLASRLTSAAPKCGVACCVNSLKWVKLRSRYRSIGEVSLKGIREPVEVFQILAVVEPDRV